MTTLEDLTKDIKALKQVHPRELNKLYITKHGELIDALLKQYEGLTLTDLGQILYHDFELKVYKCKICGKTIHYSKHYRQFGKYCSSDCMRKDPEAMQRAIDRRREKFGTLALMNVPEVRAKIDATNLRKYGNAIYLRSKHHQESRKQAINKYYFKLRGETYDKILNKCEESKKLKVLTSKIDFQNAPMRKYEYRLKWHCEKCGKTFEAYYANGALPVCPYCKPKSQMQLDVADFIKSIYPGSVEINTRKVLSPQEIDIYLPDLKLGIEFNGNFWHAADRVGETYHVDKLNKAEGIGIKLINIFEYDWTNNKEQVKHRLRYLIMPNKTSIFARKCTIRQITSNIAKDFLDKYHLQGNCKAAVKLGLYYGDELVSVMTFGTPRFNKSYQWELIRFASKYNVPGGAGKLLKYFERTFNPKSIISYANRCWTIQANNVYLKLGFKQVKVSEPSYVYVEQDSYKVLSRYQAQKKRLKALLPIFDPALTEEENMNANKFTKVFDCGNLVMAKIY